MRHQEVAAACRGDTVLDPQAPTGNPQNQSPEVRRGAAGNGGGNELEAGRAGRRRSDTLQPRPGAGARRRLAGGVWAKICS
jgi:hypothetical protein